MSGASGHQTSAVRRITRELKEIDESPSKHWTASPVADDLFEWQFAVRGPPGTDFEGGIYTGRLVLPVNYPFAPPSITMLTPNGRWEINKKICLSNTSYHAELWQPAWGIRTMMEALRSHFPVPGDGAIGAIDWPSDLRKRLAKESLDFVCPPNTKPNRELLPELSAEELREDQPEPVPPELRASTVAEAELLATTAGQEAAGNHDTISAAAAHALSEISPPTPQSVSAVSAEGPGQLAGASALAGPVVGSIDAPASSARVEQPGSPPTHANPSDIAANVAANPSVANANALGTRTPQAQPSRRRRDDSRPQRRPQAPIVVQLLKPPQTYRGWVLLVINMLIFLLSISFVVVFVDILRSPPTLLDPLPGGSKES